METYRLKIKIGNHEFEAEGPTELVQEQLKVFKEMVENAPYTTQHSAVEPNGTPRPEQKPEGVAPTLEGNGNNLGAVDGQIDKITKVDERIVSLTVRANSDEDAVLLMIYGQKVQRGNDAVTGFEIVEGLKVSGQPVTGSYRILNRIAREGRIIAVGQHRGKRYRMTNSGLRRAREIAKELIDIVA